MWVLFIDNNEVDWDDLIENNYEVDIYKNRLVWRYQNSKFSNKAVLFGTD